MTNLFFNQWIQLSNAVVSVVIGVIFLIAFFLLYWWWCWLDVGVLLWIIWVGFVWSVIEGELDVDDVDDEPDTDVIDELGD